MFFPTCALFPPSLLFAGFAYPRLFHSGSLQQPAFFLFFLQALFPLLPTELADTSKREGLPPLRGNHVTCSFTLKGDQFFWLLPPFSDTPPSPAAFISFNFVAHPFFLPCVHLTLFSSLRSFCCLLKSDLLVSPYVFGLPPSSNFFFLLPSTHCPSKSG